MKFDRSLIERFDTDADVPARAIEGLTREELLWKPMPADAAMLGLWSIQELIVHLMDSHVFAATRMRRIAAEDRPLLIGYDENAFVEKLHYHDTDVQTAAEVFRHTQRLTANMLRQLPDESFDRVGIHNEVGKITLGSLVPSYIKHVEHHMMFLRAKRKSLGKPLAW